MKDKKENKTLGEFISNIKQYEIGFYNVKEKGCYRFRTVTYGAKYYSLQEVIDNNNEEQLNKNIINIEGNNYNYLITI